MQKEAEKLCEGEGKEEGKSEGKERNQSLKDYYLLLST
jgi:hypothetical protein